MGNRTGYDIVIVGGGVAAGAAATTLREDGYSGSIAVVTAEPHPPYTRPGLTKQVLRGEKPPSAALWRPEEWYAEHDVDLLMGAAATDIDLAARRVRVAGRTIGYGKLVLATGADPRELPFAADLADLVHVVRSFADADAIRPHLGPDHSWLVVGGAFIGAEFAASARLTGSEVHLVMLEDVLLEGPFGPTAGSWFDDRLRDQGVDVHAATTVSSLERSDGRVRAVLSDGSDLLVDRVLIGAGVRPNVGLAQQAGLELAPGGRSGIAVDGCFRTSDPHVYAIGDVAAFESVLHGERVRIEHWAVAKAQGEHVAHELSGTSSEPYAVLPYFFGTMADWAFLEYVGVGSGRSVVRGDLGGDDLSIAYLDDDDRLVALLTVAQPDDLAAARTLVPARTVVDPERIADRSVPLAECAIAPVQA